jgi:hypothetical protein
MTDKEFTFDYAWMENLKLRDYEDFERITKKPWSDVFTGSVTYDDNGKVVYDQDGNVMRTHRTDVQVAFIYILKRIDDPSITLEDVKDLPGIELQKLQVKAVEFFNEALDTAKKAAGVKARGSRAQKA